MSTRHPLAQLRRDRGWSQEEVAAKSGVSRAEISGIETGRLVPSVAVALRVVAALGSTVEAVFGPLDRVRAISWAWHPAAADGRAWQAS
ncbi:MAG TPA: helix-turn-helix transcriptional regulator, partial [Methylomirabilota bacterium]|nr:helix-turn-helix transcriptional regulator [Methylomirabilota bacterium]